VSDYTSDDEDNAAAGDSDTQPAEEAAPVVSLHAISGICTEDMMMVPIYIHGHRLTALLDSGSMHNFIHVHQMHRLGLTTSSASMRVMVTNGDRVPCGTVARNVAMHMGKEDFTISCFGIDLGGFDPVLGVNYLRTLGPILWDFEDLCMAFTWQGHCVFWGDWVPSRRHLRADPVHPGGRPRAPTSQRPSTAV